MAASPSRRGEEKSENEIEKYNALRALYKVLSPEHLLRKNFANDANSLDQNFYEELLYIMGLEEVKSGGKKIIQRRKEGERVKASLIESAMYALEEDILSENERFETALHLCITWINRLLFLKLMESQQLSYQKGNKAYKFLTKEMIPTFDDLNDLFFKVLAKRAEERNEELKEKFSFVPYLNSSLFERSAEEKKTHILMSSLKQRAFPFFKQTVLKTQFGVRRTGEIDNLEYILSFLDAYNFSSESAEGITTDTKTLINASVLGLIFEKINGYKDGSFFTPSFITEYMAKEAIERAVIEKFNSAKGWKCKTIAEIEDEIEDRAEANEIFNTIRVLDPAVGSGHFLVSALNRLLFVKWQLGILCDKNGKRIKKRDWTMSLENDEISLTDEDGEAFEYKAQNEESQRVQETLFREKKSLIENCLFGVDINPASVYICRLRLWIELLKNAYYKMDGVKTGEVASLETLPNIDINIKCGNSLISKYRVEVGASAFLRNEKDSTKDKEITQLIKEYRTAVNIYKNDSDKFHKREVDETIQKLRAKLGEEAQLSLFDMDKNKEKEIQLYYKNSLEWMLEFPEVLEDDGRFLGFDVVISNPPYGVSIKDAYREAVIDTLGKVPDFEIYYYFSILAQKLLKDMAVMSFIIPNTWLFNTFAKEWRKNLLDKWNLELVLDCSKFNIFDEATVRNSIIIFQKTNVPTRTVTYKNTNGIESFRGLIAQENSSLSESEIMAMNQNWGLAFKLTPHIISIVNKVKAQNNRISNFFDCSQGYIPYRLSDLVKVFGEEQGTKIKEKRLWHSPVKNKEFFIQEIYGRDISKYSAVASGDFVKYGKHCASYVDLKFFTQPRLLVREITNPSIIACYTEETYINDPQILVIIAKTKTSNLKYLWGILNSKLATFYHFNHSPKATKGAFPKILIQDIKDFPLPDATTEEQKKIIDLVDKILAATATGGSVKACADTEALEAEIDSLVYALYGLTEDEIATVEGE